MSAAGSATSSTRSVPRARTRLTPRAAILALVVGALLLYLLVPLRAYMAQRAHLSRLEQQTEVLAEQNVKLRAQIAQLEDPAYLERVARECLGMVKKGEIAFVIVPKDGPARPADC